MQTTYGASYQNFSRNSAFKSEKKMMPLKANSGPVITPLPLSTLRKSHSDYFQPAAKSVSFLKQDTTIQSKRPLTIQNRSLSQNSILFSNNTASSFNPNSSASNPFVSRSVSSKAKPSNSQIILTRSVNLQHMFNQIAEITDHLYLSSINPVRLENVRSLGITLIVSAILDVPPLLRSPGVESIHVQVDDAEYASLRPYFDRIADRILAEKARGGKVLVHCMAGVSRSASLVLAYLMKHRSMSLRDAFNYVRSKRPYICPNIGFWRQLLEFEERIHKNRSVKLISNGRGLIPDVLLSSSSRSRSSEAPSFQSRKTVSSSALRSSLTLPRTLNLANR